MKIYSHGTLGIYKYRIFGQKYTIPQNQWIEIPEKTAHYLLEHYKDELCNVDRELAPSEHSCTRSLGTKGSVATPVTTVSSGMLYNTSVIEQAPVDRMMKGRTSQSRLNTIRRQRKLSKRARMGVK